jgi:hypothetical protein
MIQPDPFNPYAPPQRAEAPVERGPRVAHDASSIQAALRDLEAYTRDPGALAQDLATAGPRIRIVTWASLGLLVLGAVLSGLGLQDHGPMLPFGLIILVLSAVVGSALLFADLSLVPREQPGTPDASLKAWLRAVAMHRMGYAWVSLCPAARERPVVSPTVGDVLSGGEKLYVSTVEGMKAYAGTFTRAKGGRIRQLSFKKPRVVEHDGDVAAVECELVFSSWPQWVTIVLAIGFMFFRLLGLVGLVLWGRSTSCT